MLFWEKSFDEHLKQTREVGFVDKVILSVVEVVGLPGAHIGEMILFETGQLGQVTGLGVTAVEVLVLSEQLVRVGTRVARLGQKLAIGVGDVLLGKAVDVLGKPIFGQLEGDYTETRPIDITPSGIGVRKKINRRLFTGVMLVDLMIPIGQGQRELVTGDRKTGKSHFLMQTILANSKAGGVSIYAAIGKKRAEIMKLEGFLRAQGIMETCILVAVSSQDSAGEIFLTPYTAMTIAEYFRDQGRDVLLVLDDMTTHAKFYRELSLLLRKFPGRDSYPGDIFHVHSKLIERAGNFLVKDKEVAITCLPVVESIMGDITGYVQTNMMSMTDGHIYFDNDLFFRGRRPAIDPFVSVTRVGRQTQTPLTRDAGRVLYELLNSYEKTQSFLKFGAELGESSRQILAMGDRVLAFFDQPQYTVVPGNVQIALLALLLSGVWDGKNTLKMVEAYIKDTGVRSQMDDMVSKAGAMGELIEAVRKLAENYLKILK